MPPAFGKEMGKGFQLANISNTGIGHFIFGDVDFGFNAAVCDPRSTMGKRCSLMPSGEK